MQLFTFKGVALAWGVSVLAAAAGLLAAREIASAHLRVWALPWILSVIFGAALGVTVNVLPAGSELASLSTFWATAAFLLLGASALFSQWWSHSAAGQASEDAGWQAAAGVAGLGIGLAGAQAMALQGMQFRNLPDGGQRGRRPRRARVDGGGFSRRAGGGDRRAQRVVRLAQPCAQPLAGDIAQRSQHPTAPRRPSATH